MAYVVWGLVVLLLILHQDNWFWDDNTLVFGFMPVGLLYHAGISVAAAFTWYLATIFAWPEELDRAEAERAKNNQRTGSPQEAAQ